MSAIFILLTASMLVAFGFVCAFIWGVKDHQFDDEYSPPVRILFDDAPAADGNDHPKQSNPTTI